MKLSVIIPTIGTSRWLDESIHSCLNQIEPFDEIVVVDNSEKLDVRSTSRFDRNKAIRWEIAKPARLPAHENWNLSIQMTSSEYVLIHGDDDLLLPYYASASRQGIDAGHHVIFHDFSQIDEAHTYNPDLLNDKNNDIENIKLNFREYLDDEFLIERALGSFRLRVVGVVFLKDLYNQVGGMMNSGMPSEWYTDDLLWFRMASYSGNIARITNETWAYRQIKDWAGNIHSADEYEKCFSDYIDLLINNVNPTSRIYKLVSNSDFMSKYRNRCSSVWAQFEKK